jgi:uncharacterized membrane protein
MDRGYGLPPFPRGGFRGELVERLGEGGGWPDALAWAIFAVLLIILLIAIVSLALDAYYRSQGPRPFMKRLPPGIRAGVVPGGGALAVLGVRYARGEISREEYLQAREDLGGSPDNAAEAPTEVVPPPEAPPEGRGKTES